MSLKTDEFDKVVRGNYDRWVSDYPEAQGKDTMVALRTVALLQAKEAGMKMEGDLTGSGVGRPGMEGVKG